MPATDASVDLYWVPLGAGGRFVRRNGRIYEALAARLEHRDRSDLYHSALEVHLAGDRYVIEQAPVWNMSQIDRGVVGEGPVGAAWLLARSGHDTRTIAPRPHVAARRAGAPG